MAYRFSSAWLRTSIGAFNGFTMHNQPSSMAALLKRNAVGAWHAISVIDDGAGTNFTFDQEFNPSNQLVTDLTLSGGAATTTAITDTTNFGIFGYTWDGTAGAGGIIFYWKLGAGAWNTFPAAMGSLSATAIGSAYRHIIGAEAGLGDLASYDMVCIGKLKATTLSTGVFESLDMAGIASWDAVFTGANAWLLGFDDIATRTDRTGNGGNEVSRAGSGITLVADPAGWSWGAPPATKAPPPPRRRFPGALLIR